MPEVLAAGGDQLLVGVRREAGTAARAGPPRARTAGSPRSRPQPPPATGAWRPGTRWPPTATGSSGIGGDRGGAHGNVRWSVWTGSAAGVAEHSQAFSTFGGWGAGDLIDAVLTPGGSAVVGSWQSDDAGQDVAVWTPEGDTWVRRSSTGTALQSTRSAAVGSPPRRPRSGRASSSRAGGSRPGRARARHRWCGSRAGRAGWTKTVLPDAGKAGAAAAIRCAAATCAVSGRWTECWRCGSLADGRWSRVQGLPPIPVGDADQLAAPLDPDGPLDADRRRPGSGEDRRGGGDDVDAERRRDRPARSPPRCGSARRSTSSPETRPPAAVAGRCGGTALRRGQAAARRAVDVGIPG